MKKKNKLSTRNKISSTYPEEYTGKWNTSTQLTTMLHNKKAKKLYTTICDDKDKYFNKDKTEANLNKNVLIKCIPISNASEEEKELTILKKKKKKKRKEDKKKVQNNENSKTDKTILKTRKRYTETIDDYDKDLNKDKVVDSNINKDEWTRRIPIANDLEGNSLFKKKKKKKKKDKKMEQNDEDSTNNKATLNVVKFYDETLHDNYKGLDEDKTRDSNLTKDEWTRKIPIANGPEVNSLFKEKKKKKKRNKQMVQNDEDSTNDIASLNVDKFCNETIHDNYQHLNKDETRDSNLCKAEWKKKNHFANAPEDDSLFKEKKKKKKRNKQMVQNDEDSTNDIASLNVDKFYNETIHDNYQHLNKDETRDFNLYEEEWTRRIPIANASEVDSLFKKKKKKKKGDKQMVQNDEDSKNDKATMILEKTLDDIDKHLNKDETKNSNLYKEERTRRIPIANASEGDSLFKKKKKKKNGDKKMVQKYEHFKNDKATLKVEQFHNETSDDNVKNLNKINLSASNLNKDDLITRIQIANNSEDNKEMKLLKSPLKNTKKKKKKSKMTIKEDTVPSNYESIQTFSKNMEYLNKNISEEQSNEIHYGSAMVNTSYNSSISKVHIHYPELFQKLLKKKKKNKKKSIKVVKCKEVISLKKTNKRKRQTSDEEYSKNDSPQSADTDVETCDSNNYIGKDCSKKLEFIDSVDDQTSEYRTMTETDTDSTMMTIPHNSRVSKVHEEYPELFHNLLKKKNKEQKKANKVVTSKEIMSSKKSNKRKRQSIDNEYSKNDSLQSVDRNVETYDHNNHIGEDGGKKLEFFDSVDDDPPSDYRTMTNTGIYFRQYCNQTFNNVSGVNSLENVIIGKTPLQCDICFKTISCRSKFVRHKRTHTGEKPYACDVCGQSFSEKINLVTHKRIHTGEKPYACNVCGQSFSVKGTLVRHNRTHTGEKPYACDVCGQSFSLKGTLVTHKRTHTGEKPYACDVCGQSFSQQAHLVSHKRTHTGEKPYACIVCGRSFSQQGTLVVHNRTHTGERPFECGQCEKKFIDSSNLRVHNLKVHMKCF